MKKQAFCILWILGIMPAAYADAPVEDYSTDATATTPLVNTINATASSSSHWQEQKKEGLPKNQEKQSLEKSAAINIPDPVVATNTAPSSNTYNNIDTSNLSLEQRIKRLEQQTSYFSKNNSQSQLEDLRQKIEKVSGELDVQQHKLEQLEKQLTDFYTDLDQRLKNKNSKTKENSGSSDNKTASNKNDLADDDNSRVETKSAQPNKKNKLTKNPKKPDAQATSTTSVSNNASIPTDGNAVDTTVDNKDTTEPSNKNLSKKEAAIKEQQTYHAAFDYLQNKQFNDGAKKLREYLATYPSGTYAANAHYWLGEIYFLNNTYSKANSEFSTVINKYSSSSKIPEALFKLAYIHDKDGKHEQAQKEYRALKKRFPNSAAAKLAEQQLQVSESTTAQ